MGSLLLQLIFPSINPPFNLSLTNMKVAFQGANGSFSSFAAKQLCGPTFTPFHTSRFREIFELVYNGTVDCGVVPLENAIAGSVHGNYDLLAEFNCIIAAEYFCPVSLAVLGVPGTSLSSITTVASHPKALEQCAKFFEQNAHITQVQADDTASAALLVLHRNDRSFCAIASEECAELYGLQIVAREIQSHVNNATRFVLIRKSHSIAQKPLGGDGSATKASLLFSLPHKAGALSKVLRRCAEFDWNITKIESRPIVGTKFHYCFYLDLTSSEALSRDTVQKELTDVTSELRVLGIYPATDWS